MLVLPASIGCVVIDVDDLSCLDAVLEACGPTPYRTHSGRPGGGVHLWYSGTSRSNVVVPGMVDVRGSGGVAVAPGTLHAGTGLEYVPSDELAEALESGRFDPPALPKDWRERVKRMVRGLENPQRLDLATLADALREQARTREIGKRLRAVAEGKSPADSGERDTVLFRCLSTLAEHWPRAQPEAMLSLWRPVLDAWEQEDADEDRASKDWHAICAEKWERLVGAQEERASELSEHDARRRRIAWAWVGRRDCTDSADPHDAPLVVHKGRSYYLRIGEYWHGPVTRDDLAQDMLAILRSLYGVDVADFAGLLATYGQPLREIEHSFTVARTTLSPCGALIVRAGEVRQLEARFDAVVARGIALLGGRYSGHLEHWIAGLLRHDRSARALVLSGPGGVGKSLLLTGLARLWRGGYAKMSKVLGKQFNAEIARTPFVLADDEDAGENGQALAGFLRQAVTERVQSVERKGHDVHQLHGSVRFAVGTNDAMELVRGAVSHRLNDASVAAFADRLLHIPCSADATGWWGGTEAEATSLVEDDRIAMHALWLAERHTEPLERFWTPAADESLHRLVTLSSGMRGEILLRLALSASVPGAELVSGVWRVDRVAFIEGWGVNAPRGWSLRSGALACQALSEASGRRDGGITHELVQWYAAECGLRARER